MLDTLEDIHDAVNHTMNLFGWPERTLEQVRNGVGNGAAFMMNVSIPDGNRDPRYEEACIYYRDYYNSHNNIKTRPYPGITELMDKLSEAGVKMAIVSNKPHESVEELRKFWFSKWIDIGVGETVSVKRKPAPDTVIAAMDMLKLEREQCVYVGDSEVDVLTAENCGIDCVTVSWGFRNSGQLKEAGAKVICTYWQEVLERITER